MERLLRQICLTSTDPKIEEVIIRILHLGWWLHQRQLLWQSAPIIGASDRWVAQMLLLAFLHHLIIGASCILIQDLWALPTDPTGQEVLPKCYLITLFHLWPWLQLCVALGTRAFRHTPIPRAASSAVGCQPWLQLFGFCCSSFSGHPLILLALISEVTWALVALIVVQMIGASFSEQLHWSVGCLVLWFLLGPALLQFKQCHTQKQSTETSSCPYICSRWSWRWSYM